MRILGIDPGSVNLGYGVVDVEEEVWMVDCGVLTVSSRIPIEERLRSLYDKLNEVVAQHHPDEVAIEEPFVGRNVRSALAIGRAQAIAMLVAANRGLSVYRYSPAQIKQQLTNYGGSGKEQIQAMVKIQLGLPQVPQTSDAADALAVALCHIQQSRFNRWLAERS